MKRALQRIDRKRATARHRRKRPQERVEPKPATAAIRLIRSFYAAGDMFKVFHRRLYYGRLQERHERDAARRPS